MPEKEPLRLVDAKFIGLSADRETKTAVLELVGEDIGRIGVVLSHAALQSLYHHILTASSEEQLAFALRPDSGD